MVFPKKQYKWLILPIETMVREYYGKLLLAAAAAEHGWGVILAYKDILDNLPQLNGLIIELNFKKTRQVKDYINQGYRVCAMDEEGLIFYDPDYYTQYRLDKEAIDSLDLMFLWGNNQKETITSKIEDIDPKLVVTGSPRIDLLRPELRSIYSEETKYIRDKFGKFILINTNFSFFNHVLGEFYKFKGHKKNKTYKTEEQEKEQFARGEHQKILIEEIIKVLPRIRNEFPDLKIIIRPHPAENLTTWRNAVKNISDIFVIHAGDVVPWMLASEVVIHNSCTTGLQAYLLDKPVIAYLPVRSRYDKYLPNAVSYQAMDQVELINLIRNLVSDNKTLDPQIAIEQNRIIHEHLNALEGKLAVDRIIAAIEILDITPESLDTQALLIDLQRESRTSPAKKITQISKNFIKRILNIGKSRQSIGNYSFSLKEVQADLEKFQNITGRFHNIQISKAGRNQIYFTPKEE